VCALCLVLSVLVDWVLQDVMGESEYEKQLLKQAAQEIHDDEDHDDRTRRGGGRRGHNAMDERETAYPELQLATPTSARFLLQRGTPAHGARKRPPSPVYLGKVTTDTLHACSRREGAS
jgi:hypothetical protein